VFFSEFDPDVDDDPTPSHLVYLDCLISDGDEQLGRGLDLAREHGQVDWDADPWRVVRPGRSRGGRRMTDLHRHVRRRPPLHQRPSAAMTRPGVPRGTTPRVVQERCTPWWSSVQLLFPLFARFTIRTGWEARRLSTGSGGQSGSRPLPADAATAPGCPPLRLREALASHSAAREGASSPRHLAEPVGRLAREWFPRADVVRRHPGGTRAPLPRRRGSTRQRQAGRSRRGPRQKRPTLAELAGIAAAFNAVQQRHPSR
jgi:hypothetical protein